MNRHKLRNRMNSHAEDVSYVGSRLAEISGEIEEVSRLLYAPPISDRRHQYDNIKSKLEYQVEQLSSIIKRMTDIHEHMRPNTDFLSNSRFNPNYD